jgi:2',3'-cyclic-nucleotide 2'-phosphodiesterase (5'-nucleotidase family)
VGTNDLHGGILSSDGKGGLALFASYVAAVRAARAHDGAVLLIDAGDMFQGTLPSNLTEGAVVVQAYTALGYDAAAIGNHEFDYGPVGERVTPREPDENPFGALQARAREATFPFLAANLIDRATGRPIAWPNVRPSVMLEKACVRIGVIGVTTEATLRSTMAANVKTLAMAPIVETVIDEASSLRRQGAQVIVVAAHAGGRCRDLTNPQDVASCEPSHEIMQVVSALPAGTADVIVAGHTHAGMANVINGVPVVEAYANGRAFSRIDVTVDRGTVTRVNVHPPTDIAEGAVFEGTTIAASSQVAGILEPAVAGARAEAQKPLDVTLADPITRAFPVESAEGNLFADLMLAARPAARIALTNGGGLRADLPAGPLTYGELYEAMPFDNRFALVTLTGAELETIIARNLGGSDGILSIAGTTVDARCQNGSLIADTPFGPDERIVVATSDFLATGALFAQLPADRVTIEDGPTLRDEMAAVLRKRGGRLRSADVFDPLQPRIKYPGRRPVRCQ